MRIHPSVLQLSRRLWLFAPIAGSMALVTDLLSLSHDSFPGFSAALVAEAAGLVSFSAAAHPFFSFLTRQVASVDVFSLTVRLNLFSAFCGTLCACLLYAVVGRLILFAASEDEGGEVPCERMDDEAPEAPALHAEIEANNRRVFRTAVFGGLVAAFLLSFLTPSWTAATRLDNGPFGLLLALAGFLLYPVCGSSVWLVRLSISVFIFVLGLFDSAAFLLLLPYMAYQVLSDFVTSEHRSALVGLTVVAGLAATALSVLFYCSNMDTQMFAAPLDMFATFVRSVAHHHVDELRSFFPRSGWLLAVIQFGLPATILLFGQQLLFKERRPNTLAALILVVVASVPSLLNLSISPFFLFQPIGHLPVFGTALIAGAVGCVVSACLVFIGTDDQSADADVTASQDDEMCESDLSATLDFQQQRRCTVLRGVAFGMLPVILILVAATPLCSFRDVNVHQGAYADRLAREILETMKGRSCLITSGLLDNHLLVQARMLGRPLTLVPVRSLVSPQELESIKRFILTNPFFKTMNRQRLINALSLSPTRFVMEWFSLDVDAGRYAMVLATPDIWTACGYEAIPEGMAFGGIRAGGTLDNRRLAEQNRMFVDRVGGCLARQYPEYGPTASIRAMLRLKAGFVANELGVLLEERGAFEEAYAAYLRATVLDPVNVSAAVNAYALTSLHGLHPESGDVLKKRMRNALLNVRANDARSLTWVLQNHGTIRQQAFYNQQSSMWASLGARTVATAKRVKAQTLAERTGAAALLDNATVYLQSGDTSNAEQCLSSVLQQDDNNRDALVGMCTLSLGKQQPKDAEVWLSKALDAGVAPLALRYQSATLAILKNEKEHALNLLEAATKENPTDLRLWALLADLLLGRGDTQRVEHQLLPDMQAALKTTNHYLMHAIRGMTLRRKGASYYREARLCLLNALALNASLSDIWDTLLDLDMAIGNAEFTEADTRRRLGVDPDHALANYLMGALLLSHGALPEAEDFLRRSIEKKPTAAAYNDLAENLRRQRRLSEAETIIHRAVELDPALIPAVDTLACILLDAGKYGEASQLAAKAVDANPSQPLYQLTLLRALVKLGDKAEVSQRLDVLASFQTELPDDLRKDISAMK